MKNTLFAIVIVAVLFCGNALAQTGSKSDEAAIGAVLEQFGTAFETGDMKSFGNLLTANVVHVDPFGRVVSGRGEVQKHMEWVRTVAYGGKKMTAVVSDFAINFISSDAALVTMRYESTADGTTVRERVTFTLARVGSDWKVAHFQPVMIADPSQKQ